MHRYCKITFTFLLFTIFIVGSAYAENPVEDAKSTHITSSMLDTLKVNNGEQNVAPKTGKDARSIKVSTSSPTGYSRAGASDPSISISGSVDLTYGYIGSL